MQRHRYGLMGTVIFHLLLLIVLVSLGISRQVIHREMEIQLTMPDPERVQQAEQQKERLEEIRRRSSDEEVQQLLRSLAVNENVRRPENTSSAVHDYERAIRRELAGTYGDRYAARSDARHAEDSLQYQQAMEQQRLDSLQSVVYAGESSVSYNLEGRYRRHLPIPVFKCEFGGTVKVLIAVNRKGRVLKAEVVDGESDRDENLREVAVDAALRSRFSESEKAPDPQTGNITYRFVKQ